MVFNFSSFLQVGRTSLDQCSLNYNSDPDSCNIDTSAKVRSFSSPSGGHVGLVFGQFMSGSNLAPKKPFKGLMSYNSISGLTRVTSKLYSRFIFPNQSRNSHYTYSTSCANSKAIFLQYFQLSL